MLVGREKELHLLHDIQNDDSSHFVAVYGRRRVGKTFLIVRPLAIDLHFSMPVCQREE